MQANSFVALAGATGSMGALIAAELSKRDISVKALVRPGSASNATKLGPLTKLSGVTITEVDMSDVQALSRELRGARAVVSALQGLADVLLKTQGRLLQAAVAAQVPRFIPSDYSLDFTKTKPGSNRNIDLHREFHSQLESSGIAWTSVMNGCFTEILLLPAAFVNRHQAHSVH